MDRPLIGESQMEFARTFDAWWEERKSDLDLSRPPVEPEARWHRRVTPYIAGRFECDLFYRGQIEIWDACPKKRWLIRDTLRFDP